MKNLDMNFILSYKMGLDDTFSFHCTSCGKCCKNREDVVLTPNDLFARYFGRSPAEIAAIYCDTLHRKKYPLASGPD